MTVPIIGDISFYDMNMYFFIYAFLGWIMEVIFATLKTGKFVNRGFLNGPVCPIYGVGMAFCVLFLNSYQDKWWLLFLVGMAFSSLLELFTGFVLDKIFKTKWWDYSKEPFNLKGYICLRFSIIWGLGILLIFKTLVPLTDKLITLIPCYNIGLYILGFLWLVLIVDIITSVIQIKEIKRNLNEYNKIAELYHKNSDRIGEKISDVTIGISEKVKTLKGKLENTRLGRAFPAIVKKIKDLKGEDKTNKK